MNDPGRPVAGGHDLHGRRAALLAVSLSCFTTPQMHSAVNVAVPSIAGALAADAILSSWIATAYLLSTAVFLVPAGKLADREGRKRVFLIGTAVFVVTTLIAAAAPGIEALLAARVLQGVGAAMVFATQTAIVTSIFPASERGRAIGISTASVFVGLTLGPLLGGWFTEHFGWRAVFLYQVPLSLAVAWLTVQGVRGEWRGPREGGFDVAGAVIYGVSMVATMFGISVLPGASGMLIALAGVAGLVLFFRYELRQAHPVFEVTLLTRNLVFAFSCCAAVLLYMATFAITFLMSLYLQYLKGMTADAAGLVMSAQPVTMALVSPWSGRLSDFVEPRWIASAGLAVTATGLALLSVVTAATSIGYVIGSLVVVGLGFALFSSPNINAIMGSVETRHYGLASSTVGIVRVFGQMLSMSIITVVFALTMGPIRVTPARYDELTVAIQDSFLIAALASALGIGFSLARGRLRG